jgi:hypothetical protein
MTTHIVAHPKHMQDVTIFAKRFVAATEAQQVETERQIGRNLWRRGYGLNACTTDDMAAGWVEADANGSDAYHRMMMAQASNDRPAPRFSEQEF